MKNTSLTIVLVALLLAFCMLTSGCTSCTIEATAAIEPTTATESTNATEPTTIENIDTPPQITLEMLRLSEHCADIPEHCMPMYCDSDCKQHCDEHCVAYVPDTLGLSVASPDGILYVVDQATAENRYDMTVDLSNVTVMTVKPSKTFITAGTYYVIDLDGNPDPNNESAPPMTEEELGNLGAAIPISNSRLGLIYLLDPETGDFLLVLPATLRPARNWWE